jgi:predicted nucleic acid-binding protein
VIVDTGPLVAAADRADSWHRKCAEFLAAATAPLLVPPTVVTEVCYMVARTGGGEAEAAFLRLFGEGLLTFVELDPADLGRMADLTERYSDFPLGCVDASVVAVAERLGITEVATLDRKHFGVVRPRHVERFTLLPG